MGRRLAWLSAFALAALACQEELTAPGACPEFCPSTLITVVDTVLRGAVVRDSSFRGYVRPNRAVVLQVANDATGPTSRGVIKFLQFSEGFVLTGIDTSDIVAIDSFTVQVVVANRADVAGLELRLYRLPPSIDSLVALADVEAFLQDSTLITTFAVPDTVAAGDTLGIAFGPEALPSFDADERVVAIAVELRAPTPTFLDLGALRGGGPATLTRFIKVDSAGVEVVERSDPRTLEFDTFVFPARPDPTGEELTAGGVPSARSILRVELPARILDSSNIVRATLILVPSQAVLGASGDTFTVQAERLAADFGPKSPIIPNVTPGVGSTEVAVGAVDTVRVDITLIVRGWGLDPTVPRSFMIRVTPEASGLGELRFHSSRSQVGRPALQVTYVPTILP